jgi:hypothetical protein
MRFRILDAGTPHGLAEWKEAWEGLPGREIMAHPEYAVLFKRPCDAAMAALGEDRGGTILFPLVLRPLAAERWASARDGRWDAITPYGYGGPFAWGPGPRDDAAFWAGYAPDDGVFRHKRNFAPRGVVPFRVAALTHDPRAYDELARMRARSAAAHGEAWQPRDGFFPLYRS